MPDLSWGNSGNGGCGAGEKFEHGGMFRLPQECTWESAIYKGC